ncbi:hypothetical protein HPB48_020775 [Haemaphysalis longicornis]|uniref:YqaJ viral recombinase domain-containing protein n=1 Tax=Haemaphysalis longicornis TaxID=44386 RepID=A0A9J6FCJ2_HAELO|nr:hypothetical protein HPB48_020775 [Haemaphysalis longicornis]
MHGLLEVKCPYSQKGESVSEIEPLYMVKDHQGAFRLDRSHDYYFQVLGQMALAGLSWTDLAVFSDQFMIVERIRLCEHDWTARPKLDNFFFLFCCLIKPSKCDKRGNAEIASQEKHTLCCKFTLQAPRCQIST